MTFRQRSRLVFAFAILVAIVTRPGFGQTPGQAVPQVPTTAVPNWLAWKVFYESLAFYQARAGGQVTETAASQFGLDAGEAATLSNAGQAFVAAIARIDAEARAGIEVRYGTIQPPANLPRPPNRQPPGPRIKREPGKTVLDMVRESGLYEQVQAKKNATLAAHVSQLTNAFGTVKMARLRAWVETTIASRIKVF